MRLARAALSLLLAAATASAQVVEVRSPAPNVVSPVPVVAEAVSPSALSALTGVLPAASLTLPTAPSAFLTTLPNAAQPVVASQPGASPALAALRTVLPAASAGSVPGPTAAVPTALKPADLSAALFDGAASKPLVLLAGDDAASRSFLAEHPDGAAVDARRFRQMVRRVYLTAPGRKGSVSLASLRRRAERSGREDELALVKVLSDLPRLTAEGMVRSKLYVPTAAELDAAQKDWDTDDAGRPIADVVVVGAGPAGLSVGLHAAYKGLKTVVFEAGYAAQSFSDAAMKAVYRMRTPSPRNSLVQAPFSPAYLVESMGLGGRLARYRSIGQAADDALYEATGMAPAGGEREGLGTGDPSIASARNELLQHFAEGAEAFVAGGGILAEKSPVESAYKGKDGLWTVVVGGRVQRARKLVLAQGQVGTSVEHTRFPGDLRRSLIDAGLKTLMLRDHADLSSRNTEVDLWLKSAAKSRVPARRLIVADSLLGSPQIERAIRLLPRGTRMMVVGSGESAVKAALLVLRQNPGVLLDLFVKDHLQPAQLQIPATHAAPDSIAQALKDPAYAAKTVEEWEKFGTPVTPATIADLESLKKEGRLRVIALGKKCIAAACDAFPAPEHTIEIAAESRGSKTVLRVYAVDPEVVARLREEGVGSWDPAMKRWFVSEIDGPIVSAVGYDRGSLRRDKLTSALTLQGALRLKGGSTKSTAHEFEMASGSPLVSAADADLYLVGAMNVASSADSAIPGGVARAAVLVDDIAEKVASEKAARKPRAAWMRAFLRLYSAVWSRR